jgi:hypothetical protein
LKGSSSTSSFERLPFYSFSALQNFLCPDPRLAALRLGNKRKLQTQDEGLKQHRLEMKNKASRTRAERELVEEQNRLYKAKTEGHLQHKARACAMREETEEYRRARDTDKRLGIHHHGTLWNFGAGRSE